MTIEDEQKVKQLIREELSQLFYSDRYVFHKNIEILDARNIKLNTTNGTKIGTSSSEKVGFLGATPIIQRASADQAAVATTAPTQTNPYGYTTSAQALAIITLVNEVRAALVAFGLIKGSA